MQFLKHHKLTQEIQFQLSLQKKRARFQLHTAYVASADFHLNTKVSMSQSLKFSSELTFQVRAASCFPFSPENWACEVTGL